MTNGENCGIIYRSHEAKKEIWRSRVVGLARTTGNRVTVKSGSRVRISPSPPKEHLKRGAFLLRREIRTSNCVAVREGRRRTPPVADKVRRRSGSRRRTRAKSHFAKCDAVTATVQTRLASCENLSFSAKRAPQKRCFFCCGGRFEPRTA